MSSVFRFKQFSIAHDKCAHKVGTDGVLLGAWAKANNPENILDVGTGSGLIALMLAQRFPEAKVTGIELDPDSADQAKENAASSPFSERVKIIAGDFTSSTISRRNMISLSATLLILKEYIPRAMKNATGRGMSSHCLKKSLLLRWHNFLTQKEM
ncbi:MAG: methyltransferase domain-containing protein [Owenweeksia sp.]|nr:methyltransferase domain-containing protein [Owenweeksia sp.]